MNALSATSRERPLDGSSKMSLTFRATAVVLLFYVFACGAILFLAVLAAVEFALGCAGGRCGWAISLRRAVQAHFGLLKTFARSFQTERPRDARILLQAAEAPGLFAAIESLCARAQIPPPRRVSLDMSVNAWVTLQGGDNMVLGLGYELLAGLRQDELETVLAHELIHAKLSRRALRHWLARGLERAAQLSRQLAGRISRRRGHATGSNLVQMAWSVSNDLAESATRVIAACWRQEEFEADRGAAEMCGAETARRTLIRVESLRRFLSRVSWRDRLAQFQGHAFTDWLAQELAAVRPLQREEMAAEIPDHYSTHPSLRDRLNALGGDNAGAGPSESDDALKLLEHPDSLAEKLMAAIQQATFDWEEQDTRALRRWAGKMRAASELSGTRAAGCALVLLAECAGALAWIMGAPLEAAVAILMTAMIGLLIFWLGRFREQFSFPQPDFALLKTTWPSGRVSAGRKDESQLRESPYALGAAGLAAKSCAALAECNYTKALAVSRLCLEEDEQCLPALLAAAVASAWLGENQESVRALAAVQRLAGLRGPEICRGAAWAFMLRGNWARAEALLQETLDQRAGNPTLFHLRALCQLRRGKIQSAIINSRRACQPVPPNLEHAKFHLELLLEGGYVREARERLAPWGKYIDEDEELMLTVVRLNLLLRDFETARHWTETLLRHSPAPHLIVRVAVFHELSGQLEEAAHLYQRALSLAYYPDACLGMARLAAERNNVAAARQHALGALSLRRALGPYATAPMLLLTPILQQLAALEPRAQLCCGWIAELGPEAIPGAAANTAFLVYAPDQNRAESYFATVVAAMNEGNTVTVAPRILWRAAPLEQQPIGPVRPGVRPLSNGVHTEWTSPPRQGAFRQLHFAGPDLEPPVCASPPLLV